MKTFAFIQARCSSSRLPGKVLLDVCGRPMLIRQIERVKHSRKIDAVIVVTSDDPSDDELAHECLARGVEVFRGALNDVLERYYKAAKYYCAERIVRITGDCPLIDPEVIDLIIDSHIKLKNDYTSNTLIPTYPDGLDVEIFNFDVLEKAYLEARKSFEREHVTVYINSNPEKFKLANITNDYDLSHLRWTVDEADDYEFVVRVYQLLKGKPLFLTADILNLLESYPSLIEINKQYFRNEGLKKSIQESRE